MALVGGIIGGVVAHQHDSAELFVFGWFLFFLGVGTYFIGFGQCGANELFKFRNLNFLGKKMLYPNIPNESFKFRNLNFLARKCYTPF